ncbi:MAG: hypothetical protein E6H03_10735 [Bacillati bacterium ANGP1]|uniref:Uncharacterized protein n=1 Tax=Candidatus Segetimicrobium genomatis TaxID=2569760 RepID=A0A537J744_9BACT|nr:MAG: hypothetical protein E6H03_10735 [Terrabacteria group bacterium ANGP1]
MTSKLMPVKKYATCRYCGKSAGLAWTNAPNGKWRLVEAGYGVRHPEQIFADPDKPHLCQKHRGREVNAAPGDGEDGAHRAGAGPDPSEEAAAIPLALTMEELKTLHTALVLVMDQGDHRARLSVAEQRELQRVRDLVTDLLLDAGERP